MKGPLVRTRLTLLLLLAYAFTTNAQPLPPPLPRADDGSVIDVLVVYTQNARAVAGGSHPQALAMIDAFGQESA